MKIGSETARRAALPAAVLILLAPAAAAQRGVTRFVRVRSLAEIGLRETVPRRVPRELIGRGDVLGGGERPAILLTGYWPPSNEGVRRFSTDPLQNPDGWIGSDWEGLGYDVHAFFPEFSDPMCSNCGQGMGDLEVDYQDTSEDFFAIVTALRPIAIVTFSRGFNDLSWEVEMNQFNRDSWLNDYTAPKQPTPSPPNPAAPANSLIPSSLPVQTIVDSVGAAGLGLTPFICISGDGGGFLSEFIAYHGVWYQSLHDSPEDPDWCVAAGHVHVGGQIAWESAQAAAETTVRALIDYVDAVADPGRCQADLGFGGPGAATLTVCGDPLASGGEADLLVTGLKPSTPGWIVAGPSQLPTPVGAGQLVPVPVEIFNPAPADPLGRFSLFGIQGGGGPVTYYVQHVSLDLGLPGNLGLSNAVALEFLP